MNIKIPFSMDWRKIVAQHMKYTAMVKPMNRAVRMWIGSIPMVIHFENHKINSEVAQLAVSHSISDQIVKSDEEKVIKEKHHQGHLVMIDLLKDRFQFGCTKKRKIPLFENWRPFRNWKENQKNKQNSSFETHSAYYYKVSLIEIINEEK